MQFCCKTNELQYCAYSVYMFHAGISERKVSMLLNKLNISFICHKSHKDRPCSIHEPFYFEILKYVPKQ